ncbi:MAG: LysR family transcriptional regulator [Burkholderiaceae bacterium]|nr:LysR family transcriptional regulator [Burkholderiaceae bacterium]
MKDFDLTRFDLNLLVVFDALWRERHVGRAANILHLSQSATSHALSRLRDAFDDQLYIRSPKGIEPTPVAVALAPQVNEILGAVREVATPRGPFDPAKVKAAFNVAATDFTIMAVVSPSLRVIQEQAPGVVLKMFPADQDTAIQKLDAGEFDIAIGSGSFTKFPARIRSESLFKERFIGIVRSGHPALIKRRGKFRMDLDEFLRYPHVLASPRGDVRGAVDDALELLGKKRIVAATCPNFLAVPFLVGASDSIAVIAERAALQMKAAAGIDLFELPIALPTWEVAAVYAAGRTQESALQWLCDVLKKAASGY